jgi:DHA1 family tetracycline resistance protein-like MFS transporter
MIWTIASPAANGMMTRRVSKSEQGEIQRAISSLRAIAVIIGPGLFTFTFAFLIDKERGWNLPGAPWYLGAALLFFAMVMATRVERPPVAAHTSNIIPSESTQSGSSVV